MAADVSAGNPCPFLRALAEGGHIDGHQEPLGSVSKLVVEAGAVPAADAGKVGRLTYLIGLVGNGLNPVRLVRSARRGLTPDELRGGPLDKRGAGSRILDVAARVNEAELARLADFAIDVPVADGEAGATERGLRAPQLAAMMDANFARAAGSRRRFDRQLMDGEWPVLLKIMGKGSGDDQYLSVAEVRALFIDRALPQRIEDRLKEHSVS